MIWPAFDVALFKIIFHPQPMIGFRHSQVALRTALTQGGTHPFRKQRQYGQANCQKF